MEEWLPCFEHGGFLLLGSKQSSTHNKHMTDKRYYATNKMSWELKEKRAVKIVKRSTTLYTTQHKVTDKSIYPLITS